VKIRTITLALGCTLATACGTLPAAESAPRAAVDIRLDPPPIHALIGHRADLDLNSEQIEALDEVGQQIHAENHPLLVQLHGIEQNGGHAAVQQEMFTIAGRVHANNHRAMERVRGMLTEDQRAGACELFAHSNGTARGLRATSTSDGMLRMVSRPTTHVHVASTSTNGPVWSWCAEPVTTAAR